ncbi:uncharacterized protein LY79DRAFT_573424 [Colletotrichum navitas]|uniref:Uncharacterized protein n=1 Tax=Colletotrichum navitas TaxID=681940 RepID=A0AAD8PJD1_9PEZI|nr:uncharacterized protein LY79DRAFT_573424 [Colletotrichum navitas]KAK1564229.1 hypothetical protein LY79DRAFT_573424 [Colletotrichum navitas]
MNYCELVMISLFFFVAVWLWFMGRKAQAGSISTILESSTWYWTLGPRFCTLTDGFNLSLLTSRILDKDSITTGSLR